MMVRKRIISVSLLVVFVLVSLLVKVHVNSSREFGVAEEFRGAGQMDRAVEHYSRAIRWYYPGNRYVVRSLEGLWAIGEEMEGKGDRRAALEAFRSIRGSLFAVRSLYTPHSRWIERADERIAALSAAVIKDREGSGGRSLDEIRRESLRLLKKDYAPSALWSALLEVGFFGWVLSALAFIWLVFDEVGGIRGRRAVFWGAAIIIFYGLWAYGLTRA